MVAPTLSPVSLLRSESRQEKKKIPTLALIDREDMLQPLNKSPLLRRWSTAFLVCIGVGALGLTAGIILLIRGIVGGNDHGRLLFFVVGNCILGASILWLVSTTLIAYHRHRGAASNTLRQLSLAEVDESVLLGLVEHLATGPFRLQRERLIALLERCKLEAELQSMEESEADSARVQHSTVSVLSDGYARMSVSA